MAEQKPLSATEIGDKLVNILDGLLATGDWESSLFLKTSASRLRDLRDEAQRLAQVEDKETRSLTDNLGKRINPPEGYLQTFILIYQLDGNNLQSWLNAIKGLAEHSVTRPAYKDEQHVREFIRSKSTGTERYGYVVVNIKAANTYEVEQPPIDALNHELLPLKENAVQLANVIEFVHANKKRYSLQNTGLVYIGDVT